MIMMMGWEEDDDAIIILIYIIIIIINYSLSTTKKKKSFYYWNYIFVNRNVSIENFRCKPYSKKNMVWPRMQYLICSLKKNYNVEYKK